MRILISAVLLPIIAIPLTAQARMKPSNIVQLRIDSADSTRRVSAHVRLSGGAFYSLGGTGVPGRVNLAGDTGSVTTPAMLEVSDNPGEIILETSASDPELVVFAPRGTSSGGRSYARGHSVDVVRDSSGHLRLIAATSRGRRR